MTVQNMRSISEILGMLIVVAIVVGASIFASWLIFGTVNLYRQSTSLSVVGGEAYIDPTDSSTVLGEVVVSIVGPDRVTINYINATYSGADYPCICLNCNDVLTSSFPNSANDVVALRFYFKAQRPVNVGDRILVRVTYTVGTETKYALGSIQVVG